MPDITESIAPIAIDDIMRTAYRDYAISVITSRAIPDVRDGLKPVTRRILYAMRELGLTPDKPHRKCAGTVGEVLKEYHPHGDSSVYDALVRLAQDFTLLHPLIDPHGNFGSADGDPPAAYRYTEARLSRIAMSFFNGLDKDTVDFRPNFDGSVQEPTLLPVTWPQVIVNGDFGIAVGLASDIPPHNLREVAEAVMAYIDRPQMTTTEIAKIMLAPDFPTGGVVHDLDGYLAALETGRGSVKLRGTWTQEEDKRHTRLVVDSIPYQQIRSKIVAAIAEAIIEKQIDDVTALRDESSHGNTRIVIELRKGASTELAFNQLIAKKVGLEISINYNMMLLLDGQPRQMGIRQIFDAWIGFRFDTIRRAATFDLSKAQDRLHVLAGFIAAIGLMDRVIATIRASADGAAAREALKTLLAIDDIQAAAILDLKLQRLTGLELEAIRKEHADITAKIADLRDILEQRSRQLEILRNDLRSVASTYGKDRQTTVEHSLSALKAHDLIEREDAIVVITTNQYVKRVAASEINRQNRGTRGRQWMATGDDDQIATIRNGSTHDYLLAITADGQAHARRVYDIPESGPNTRGRHVRNVIEGVGDAQITKLLTIPSFDETTFLISISRRGSIKRTSLADLANATRRGGMSALKLDEGDAIAEIDVCQEHDHVIIVASNGRAARYIIDDRELRPMGRTAVGNRGITLSKSEHVVGMMVVHGDGTPQPRRQVATRDAEGKSVLLEEVDTQAMDHGQYLVCIGARGLGKKTPVADFSTRHRGGKGVLCFLPTKKSGALIQALGTSNDRDLILFSTKGISNRIPVNAVRSTSRTANGCVRLMNLDEGDTVARVSTLVHEAEEE